MTGDLHRCSAAFRGASQCTAAADNSLAADQRGQYQFAFLADRTYGNGRACMWKVDLTDEFALFVKYRSGSQFNRFKVLLNLVSPAAAKCGGDYLVGTPIRNGPHATDPFRRWLPPRDDHAVWSGFVHLALRAQ